MKARYRTLALWLIFGIAALVAFGTEKYGMSERVHRHAEEMQSAERLAGHWFEEVARMKESRGIMSEEAAHLDYGYMLGDEFTEMTTTLGSLRAKATAANPAFAALMVRLLTDAGIDSTSIVGVIQSASFPSLAIATLAALQTLGCEAVMISSLGSSMYGANQPSATWLDMEGWLRNRAGLRYSSSLVTRGAENDRGEGLLDGGPEAMELAAEHNGYELVMPPDLRASIKQKVSLLHERQIDLLVNIGGAQPGLGSCVHAVGIPNGYHERYRPCSCPDRGVIARLAERNVPFIHLLNVRDLAVRYGIDLEGASYGNGSDQIFVTRRARPAVVSTSLAIVALSMAVFGRFNHGRKKPTRSGRG
jgi:poly-gamma-glutamate system protein